MQSDVMAELLLCREASAKAVNAKAFIHLHFPAENCSSSVHVSPAFQPAWCQKTRIIAVASETEEASRNGADECVSAKLIVSQ